MQRRLLIYFFLAYLFSWVISVPLALSAHNFILPLPLSLHYLTAYGPMLAALLIIFTTDGKEGITKLFKKTTNWKVSPGWYLVVFSPLLVYVLVSFFQETFNLTDLGKINFLPNLSMLALPFWIFNSGIGEEIGWRGFALPELQKKYSALKSSLILGVIWFGWHIPFLFYIPNYIALGLVGAFGLALGIISGSVVYTWVYNATKGNLFLLILFHGIFNFVTASAAGRGLVDAILSTAFLIAAIAVMLFSRNEKRKVV